MNIDLTAALQEGVDDLPVVILRETHESSVFQKLLCDRAVFVVGSVANIDLVRSAELSLLFDKLLDGRTEAPDWNALYVRRTVPDAYDVWMIHLDLDASSAQTASANQKKIW